MEGQQGLGGVGKDTPFALLVRALLRQVEAAQHHILAGADRRLAVRRVQQVARREHKASRLILRLFGQRDVNGHLVTIEVGVESRTDQRVQLNGAAFDQHGLKSLDTQKGQRGSAVQEEWMVLNNLFQYVPDLWLDTLDKALGALDIMREVLLNQFAHDKRLEELQRHFLGQTALVQLEFGTNHDHRAARVVHTLAQQVLAETALLALEHVGQALELVIAGTGDRATAPAIINQGVAGFLEHALFVTNDDLRRAEFQQALETISAVDHGPIEIIEIRCCEATTVQLHHRAQIGRKHWQHGKDHPLRRSVRLAKSLDDFQTLGGLFAALADGRANLMAQVVGQFFQVNRGD